MPVLDTLPNLMDVLARGKAKAAGVDPVGVETVDVAPVESALPTESAWDQEFKKQRQKILGLDQKYNADGTPRKKKIGEKLFAGASILGTILGGAQVNDEIKDRTTKSLETGERSRIAKMQTDQKAQEAKDKIAFAREKLAADSWYKKQVAEIDRLEANGKISYQEKLAAKAQAQADRERGITEGSSVEGKYKAGVADSVAGLNKQKTLSLQGAPAEKALDRQTSILKTILAGANRPTGSTSTQTSDESGSNITNTRQTTFGNRGGTPYVDANSLLQNIFSRQNPAASASPGGVLGDPNGSAGTVQNSPNGSAGVTREKALPVPPQSTEPTNAANNLGATIGRGKDAAVGKDLSWDIKQPSAANPKYQERMRGINTVLNQARALANQTSQMYVNGTLDGASGINALPVISAARRLGQGIDPAEAVLSRMGTQMLAGSETSDFGNRVMNILVKAEQLSLSQPWYSAASKLATNIGQVYSRTLAGWEKEGSPKQKTVANEILGSPDRLQNLESSVKDYIAYVTKMRQSGAKSGIPELSPNLYLLSRSDDELRQMFPGKAKTADDIKRLRITGGDLNLKATPSTNPAKSAGPAKDVFGYPLAR